MIAMNPDCFYPQYALEARRFSCLVWLRVAKERGCEDHPAAIVAKRNLEIIERLENEFA